MDATIKSRYDKSTGQTPILLATTGFEGHDIPRLLQAGARFVRPVIERGQAETLVEQGQLDAYRTGADSTTIKAPVARRWGLVTNVFDLPPTVKRARCLFVGPTSARTTYRYVRALNCEQVFIKPLRGDRDDRRFSHDLRELFNSEHCADAPDSIAESPALAVLARLRRGLISRISPDEIDATTRRSYLFNR